VIRRLLLGYLGLTLFVLVALEVPLGIENGRTERRNLEAKVEHDATNLASIAQTAVRTRSQAQLHAVASIAYRYSKSTGGRVLITGRNGIALVDTNPSSSARETFASRPEIASALRGHVTQGVRHSSTLHANLLYVAVPVAAGGIVDGAVRITYPTSAVEARITRYWLILLAVAAVVLTLAGVAGARLAAGVTRPLRNLERAAEAVGHGDLEARAAEELGPPEVRSLAVVFNDTVARLEQLIHSQDEFVADASHQLRTPLTALRLRLENLERSVPEESRPAIEGSLGEIRRLTQLVHGLLVLARVDASVASPGIIDLARLVSERVTVWSPRAADLDLRLVTDVSHGEAVYASEDGMHQVLDNLIENALEASPPGGTVTVSVSGSELRVRDEGAGLSAEGRARAFDRFWRARSGSGSGLGLAIVRRLVEADGGEVELTAADGKGLVAIVRLRSAVSEVK
jgi:signal transduction histidine kinase